LQVLRHARSFKSTQNGQPTPPDFLDGIGGGCNSQASISTSVTVTATCALTGQPSGAIDLPTCSMVNNTVRFSGSTTQTSFVDVDVITTAATAKLAHTALPDRGDEWREVAGAALALIVFLGIPARRRNWRSMLGALILLAVLGGLSACGAGGAAGGSSGGGGGAGENSGTTAGTYTLTVNGNRSSGGNAHPDRHLHRKRKRKLSRIAGWQQPSNSALILNPGHCSEWMRLGDCWP
jgi:hypothetical protein